MILKAILIFDDIISIKRLDLNNRLRQKHFYLLH